MKRYFLESNINHKKSTADDYEKLVQALKKYKKSKRAHQEKTSGIPYLKKTDFDLMEFISPDI